MYQSISSVQRLIPYALTKFIGHEDKQKFLKALRNRQDLFQEEGILNLILDTIDKMNVVSGLGILSALAGDESGQQWDEISNYLFQILGKINTSTIGVESQKKRHGY